MFHEIVEAPDTPVPEALDRYQTALHETIDEHGDGAVDGDVIHAIERGEIETVSLSDAAALLAADPERPDAETIVAEARDNLLLNMTTAVVDVDAVAAELDSDLTPRDIQQRIEGRTPMTVAEYARIRNAIGS